MSTGLDIDWGMDANIWMHHIPEEEFNKLVNRFKAKKEEFPRFRTTKITIGECEIHLMSDKPEGEVSSPRPKGSCTSGQGGVSLNPNKEAD